MYVVKAPVGSQYQFTFFYRHVDVLPPRVAGVAVVLPLRVAVVVPRCVVLEERVAGVETFLSS